MTVSNMRVVLLITITVLCGVAEATSYHVYSCPLSSSASSLSSSSNPECSSSRKRDPTFGISHTYIQIDSMCYDWGDWDYPRRMYCSDQQLACCVKTNTLEYTGTTSCADGVGDFETAWRNQNKIYHLFYWNSQAYTNKMKQYLNTCDVHAPF